jgi:hypothetical protein
MVSILDLASPCSAEIFTTNQHRNEELKERVCCYTSTREVTRCAEHSKPNLVQLSAVDV